ncbi:MAG: 23S rRNA (guanosine(2251)-2'-O)-methyltransferase RlmB [Thermacetogeniaceae bacterium]
MQAVLRLKKKRFREREQRFIVEGVNFVEEALKSGVELDFLVCTEKGLQREKSKSLLEYQAKAGIPIYIVDEDVFAKIAETETPQGVLAVGRKPVWEEDKILERDKGIWVALDAIQDPGNLGTIIRTAEAVGAEAVFLGEGTADLYNPKALRATMGSVFRVPTFSRVNLGELLGRMKKSGIFVVAADPHAEQIYYEADLRHLRVAVVIGNEGRGIDRHLLELSDIRVKIPLEGKVESLNAAVASALILFEIRRQQQLWLQGAV